MQESRCILPLRGAFEKILPGDCFAKTGAYITPHAVDACTIAAVALATVSLLFMEERG
jgi:hypothetical protein